MLDLQLAFTQNQDEALILLATEWSIAKTQLMGLTTPRAESYT